MATTQQVADFYEVSASNLRMVVSINKEELVSDGYSVYKRGYFRESLAANNICYKKTSAVDYYSFEDGAALTVTNMGVGLFPRRAILRIGMLLRDSVVAKEVRTQLLNIEEKALQRLLMLLRTILRQFQTDKRISVGKRSLKQLITLM